MDIITNERVLEVMGGKRNLVEKSNDKTRQTDWAPVEICRINYFGDGKSRARICKERKTDIGVPETCLLYTSRCV